MRASRSLTLLGAGVSILLAAAALVAVAGQGASSARTLPAPPLADVLHLADLPGSAAPGAMPVDVELVLAVDISFSMDLEELALQREGYAQAIQSREFLTALQDGMHGRIAVTYVEWAGIADQRVVVPWRLVDGRATAGAVAAEIEAVPLRRARRTSISGVLQFSLPLFEDSGFQGIRKVIDVSGDGPNNQGPLVTVARDAAVAKGVTINGLPIMLQRSNWAALDVPNLDEYYEDCVIGGAGAFVVPVREREKFVEAIRTKLVLEIAGREPEARVILAQAREPAGRERVSCTIGERMWQERWGRDEWR